LATRHVKACCRNYLSFGDEHSSHSELNTVSVDCGAVAEISRVRGSVLSFCGDWDLLELPEPVGPSVTLSDKLTIPVKEHPEVPATWFTQRRTVVDQ